MPPGVVRWLTLLTVEGVLPTEALIRTRLVGAVYGTQQSVVDEVIDDGITLPAILLHQERPLHGAAAVDAVSDSEKAVSALGHLAGDLARAAGLDAGSATESTRDLGFGALDGPYRRWLRTLGGPMIRLRHAPSGRPSPAGSFTASVGNSLTPQARPRPRDGSSMCRVSGRASSTTPVADLWFRTRINKVLPPQRPPSHGPEAPGTAP